MEFEEFYVSVVPSQLYKAIFTRKGYHAKGSARNRFFISCKE